jgi:sugar-specific transcriptional regulator TrmB
MEMARFEKALEYAGLTHIEARVYLRLLELGSTTAGPIVKSLGLHRATAYAVLQRLIERGLVSYVTKVGKRYFSASDPESILQMIQEKEELMKEIMPQLKVKHELAKEKQSASIFEGLKGMRSVFESFLRMGEKGDEYLVFGASEDIPLANYLVNWSRKRGRKGVKLKALFGEEEVKKRSRKMAETPLTEIKYVPKTYTTPASINIFKDITGIFLWTRNPLAFVIENEEVADSFRKYFNLMWGQETKVTKGFDALRLALYNMLDDLKSGETYVAIGAGFGIMGHREKYIEFFNEYHKERMGRKIKAKLLFEQGNASIIDKMDVYKGVEVKFLPYKSESPVEIFLYRDKSIIVIQQEDPTVITIENKEIAETFRTNFEIMWDQKAEFFQGQEAVERAYNSIFDTLKAEDEVVIFAAKPTLKRGQKFNIEYTKKLRSVAKSVRLLYYGVNQKNIDRAREFEDINCETKILPTEETLPISTVVAGDVVINSIWGDNPSAFKIENKTVADSLRKNFELLWSQETRVVKGLDAIQQIFEEMLEAGQVDFIGARGYFVDMRPRYIDGWEKRAVEKGFRMRNIVDIGTKGHRITKFPFTKTRYTIQKEFSKLSVFWIYGNKVVISNWTEKEPIAVIIENKNLHDMYKQQFEMMWKEETRTYKGVENVKLVFHDIMESCDKSDTWYIYTVDKQTKEIHDFFTNLQKESSVMGISKKILFSERAIKQYEVRSNIPLSACRIVPNSFAAPGIVNVLGDVVLINFWSTEKEPIVHRIRDAKIAGMYRKYFDTLWGKGRK